MKISESFHSVQGEGASNGVPAYFIRLQGCNLLCGGHNGELVKRGKANWYCDTEKVWVKGEEVSNDQLVERLQQAGQLENILDGLTHLVWTGGEPTMPRNQKDMVDFFEYARRRFGGNNLYNEIETNGTIVTEPDFYRDYIHQINCSPKLDNSGMEYKRRVNPNAIKQILAQPNSWFKFVIGEQEDLRDAIKEYIEPFNIPKTQVILMPGTDNMEKLPYLTRMCYDMTKQFGYRTVTRGHILAWNQATGV